MEKKVQKRTGKPCGEGSPDRVELIRALSLAKRVSHPVGYLSTIIYL